MRSLAIILNVFIPGVGSFVAGYPGQGIGQILIWGLGFLLTVVTLGFGMVIGIPMMLGAWIWGIVTVVSVPAAPVTVNVNTASGTGASKD